MKSYFQIYNEVDDILENILNKENLEFEAMRRHKICCKLFLTKYMITDTYNHLLKLNITKLIIENSINTDKKDIEIPLAIAKEL
jgi:hypothetical protein